jgi:probable DNA metabolism protein
MMLGTVIHPKNRILPLLRGHFCSRLPDEDFMIFDATHGIAMLRRDRKVQYMVMEHYDKNTGQEELDWQKLWKRFFDAVTIEQRRNERCQMTHAPKRYWKDMCEMALLGRGTAGKAEQNAEAAR